MKYINQSDYRRIMLDIMSVIDEICKKNNIVYTMGGGTLLGAIRHKGFIPWDDDIDIFLPRSEYDKLIPLLKKSDCEWLSIIDDNTEGYYYPFAKATDNRTMVKMESSVIKHGVWVDIFPMENVPDDTMKRKFFLKRCQVYRAFLLSMTTDFSTQGFKLKSILKYVLRFLAKIVGPGRLYQCAKRYMHKYNDKLSEYECITWSPYGTEFVEKHLLDDVVYFDFEDRKFKGIAGYDILLKRAFGDYMQLPPENKRRTHEVTAWYV